MNHDTGRSARTPAAVHRRLWAALGAALALTLTACGGGDDDNPRPPETKVHCSCSQKYE